MLKLARVPHSKTVQRMHPNPAIEIYVPAGKFLVVLEVVAKVKMAHERIDVLLLDRAAHRDVKDGEHVYVKVQGEIVAYHSAAPYDDPMMPAAEVRRLRIKSARMRNANVVVECASVVAL